MAHTNERTFDPSRAHRLDSPERLLFLPPDDAVQHMGIRPGMHVVDIGAGTGYFALPIAHLVGAEGRVFAVDMQDEMLHLLEQKLSDRDAPANIQTQHGSAEQTGLPDACADLVLIANVWHELDDRGRVLSECARLLRSGGRLAILDWRFDVDEDTPGPPLAHRVPAGAVQSELGDGGWTGGSLEHVGLYSYLVIAERPRARG
ncbi:MAG TPA: methyltransferase domain-containing protein [Chloroflexota bacterium]|nr:methyltransferase domain-containing protein [Chloroflexota bacterium]